MFDLKNSTFIVIKEGERQYMEIDNENIWNVLNNLTSVCQRTVGLVYRHIPWGQMRMAPNNSYLNTIEKCFDCSFRMGFPYSKQNCY